MIEYRGFRAMILHEQRWHSCCPWAIEFFWSQRNSKSDKVHHSCRLTDKQPMPPRNYTIFSPRIHSSNTMSTCLGETPGIRFLKKIFNENRSISAINSGAVESGRCWAKVADVWSKVDDVKVADIWVKVADVWGKAADVTFDQQIWLISYDSYVMSNSLWVRKLIHRPLSTLGDIGHFRSWVISNILWLFENYTSAALAQHRPLWLDHRPLSYE